jgi:hypothetical protein
MSNVRLGALALALAAIMCATPTIASAEQPFITKITLPFTEYLGTCGPNGEPGLGEVVAVTGTSDVTEYLKPLGYGEWNHKFRVNGSGTGQGATATYLYHVNQAANFNLVNGTDTIIMTRTMLVREGETATPDDLVVRIFFHVSQDATGTPRVLQDRLEIECK